MNSRFLLIHFLLAVFFLCSCSKLINDSNSGSKLIPFETIQKSYTVDTRTSETHVLKNESDEKIFLKNHPLDSLPEIDYSEYVAICLLAGKRSNNSYDITIDSVVVGQIVLVHSTETGSAAGSRVIIHPAHIALIKRSDVDKHVIQFANINRVCHISPCDWEIE